MIKKLVKLSAALALMCTALVYVGCTKDSSQDVTDLSKKVSELQSKVSTNEADIKTLQAGITYLETVKTQLQELQAELAKKADKDAVAAVQQQIATINSALTDIKTTITAKADKSYVDQTFATISALNTLSSTVGTLQSSLQTLTSTVNNEVKPEITKISNTLSAAVQDIKALENELHTLYYDKGQVDGLLLLAKDSLRTEYAKTAKELQEKIDALNKDLQDEIKARAAEDGILNKAISQEISDREAADTTIYGQLSRMLAAEVAIREGADEELWVAVKKLQESSIPGALSSLKERVDALEVEIKTINDKLDQLLDYMLARFAAISERVTSIKACPTLTEDIMRVKVGDTTTTMLCADFMILPVDAAEYIVNKYKGKDLLVSLGYAEALYRNNYTKGKLPTEVEYKEARITDLRLMDNGTLRVIATDIKRDKPGKYCTYYSLAFTDSDSLGVYNVMSEFTEAIDEDFYRDLTYGFRYAKVSGDKFDYLVSPGAISYRDTTSMNYVDAEKINAEATDKLQPFVGRSVAVNFPNDERTRIAAKIFTKENYTIADFEALTGMKVKVKYSLATDEYPVKLVDRESDFNTKVYFEPEKGKGMYSYVGDIAYPFTMTYKINNVETPYLMAQDYMFTKVNQETVQLPPVRIYWNYKSYLTSERKAVVDASKDSTYIVYGPAYEYKAKVWNDAIAKGATVTKAFTTTDNRLVYSDKDQGYQPLTVTLDEAEFEKIVNGSWDIMSTVASMTKETTSDKYEFTIPTYYDHPLIVKETADSVKVDGSITRAVIVPVGGIDSLYILKDGAIRSNLINGLSGDDIKFANVKAAFDEQINNSNYEVVLSGTTEKEAIVVYDKTSGKMTVTLPAGKTNYNGKYEILVTYKSVFGREYKITVPFKTGAPKFSLVTRPYIVDGKGTVRGAVKDGKYTLDSLDYNKQVEIKDISLANEAPDAEYTVRFSYRRDKDATGLPDVTKDAISVDSSNGALGSHDPMTWGTYNGLELTIYANVYINGEPLNKVAYTIYKLVTDKPVEFKNKGKISVTKKSATPLPINVWQNLEVYGMVDGSIVKTNIMINGKNVAPAIIYGTGVEGNGGKTEYVYAETKDFKFVLNGQSCTLFDKVDYDWDSDKGLFTVKSDNLKGVLTITIPVTVNYYLDYNHTKAEKTEVVIEVSQN